MLLTVIVAICFFIAGYLVVANNPPKSVIKKILDKHS